VDARNKTGITTNKKGARFGAPFPFQY